MIVAGTLFTDRFSHAAEFLIGHINFQKVLLDVLLGFLLFAGAIHTNFDQLRIQRWPVLVFSTLGVLISTFIVGGVVFWIFGMLGLNVRFIECLLFGALISPTDPIAVLGILKQAKVPKKLETKIVGESLFNDGVGVVVFLTILSIAVAGSPVSDIPQQGVGEVHSAGTISQQPGPVESHEPNQTAAHESSAVHSGGASFVGVARLLEMTRCAERRCLHKRSNMSTGSGS